MNPTIRKPSRRSRFARFAQDVITHTPFAQMIILLIALWLAFSAGLYFAEHDVEGGTLKSYLDALYWGIAAFSTAGIADTPQSQTAKIIGAVWIVLGSAIFFGTIVATITTYFMRPLQRPARKIVDMIEFNLERLDELSVEELALLKETADTLIVHMERLKERQSNTTQR